MLTNPTYRGVHVYGKGGSKHFPEPIERAVPALVDEVTWHAAQATLKRNYRFGRRNCKR
jgi:Recombinase